MGTCSPRRRFITVMAGLITAMTVIEQQSFLGFQTGSQKTRLTKMLEVIPLIWKRSIFQCNEYMSLIQERAILISF